MYSLSRYDASIDGTLRDWVIQRMMVTERVSQAEIKQKALELILPHNPDFRASRGWVTRFLRRHSINLKGKCFINNYKCVIVLKVFILVNHA